MPCVPLSGDGRVLSRAEGRANVWVEFKGGDPTSPFSEAALDGGGAPR